MSSHRPVRPLACPARFERATLTLEALTWITYLFLLRSSAFGFDFWSALFDVALIPRPIRFENIQDLLDLMAA